MLGGERRAVYQGENQLSSLPLSGHKPGVLGTEGSRPRWLCVMSGSHSVAVTSASPLLLLCA